jgi:hypothetical protein
MGCGKHNTVNPSRISLTNACVYPNLLDVLRSPQWNAMSDGSEKTVSSPAIRQASLTEIHTAVDR